jgi:hypothetical protein
LEYVFADVPSSMFQAGMNIDPSVLIIPVGDTIFRLRCVTSLVISHLTQIALPLSLKTFTGGVQIGETLNFGISTPDSVQDSCFVASVFPFGDRDIVEAMVTTSGSDISLTATGAVIGI